MLGAMNGAQRAIAILFALVLLLVVLCPAWQQKYQGRLLVYNEHLGRHFAWSPPAATGEHSWILNVPASQCEVVENKQLMLTQSGCTIVMAGILLFALRGKPAPTASLRVLLLAGVLAALCIPAPPLDGSPLALIVVEAVITPFTDTGHVGLWLVPLFAIVALAVYSIVASALIVGMAWLSRRGASAKENI
jgi:hypothetical protein